MGRGPHGQNLVTLERLQLPFLGLRQRKLRRIELHSSSMKLAGKLGPFFDFDKDLAGGFRLASDA